MSKTNKEEKSLIDEVIELKFGKRAKSDPKKEKEIFEYLEELYSELDIFNENDECGDEDDSQHPSFEKEIVSSINSDDRKDGMIPFVVIKKEKNTIDIKCPFCGKEDKIFLNVFKGSQYDDHECIECKKKSLLKLEFSPEIKTYVEK